MFPTTVSDQAIDLIKRFEGYHEALPDGSAKAYRCPADKWTIGWGSTEGVYRGMIVTKGEAEELLLKDISVAEEAVRRQVKVPLTQVQYDALVSWTFNMGEGNLSKSTMLRKLNAGDYDAVPAEMARWNKARVNGILKPLAGLTRRRAAEGSLFAMDAPFPAEEGGEALPQSVEPTEAKPLTKSRTMVGVSVAGLATALSEASEQIRGLVEYQPILPFHEQLQLAFMLLALGGIALAAYARWDDHRKGLR